MLTTPFHLGLDASLQPNQAINHPPYVEELFSFATGKDTAGNPLLTTKDLSRMLGKRRAESKVMNKAHTLHLIHRLFGSAKCIVFPFHDDGLTDIIHSCSASTITTIFGGRVDDLRAMLLEERFPQGWESRVRKPYGLTMLDFNLSILATELGIRETDWTADVNQAVAGEEA